MRTLDSILKILQNQPPWNVQRFETVDGMLVPIDWYPVTGAVTYTVAIRDADLQTQIEEVTAQVQFWGRCEASCARVVEYSERQLRVWKGSKMIEMQTRPKDVEDVTAWKKPTVAIMEATYRQSSDYADLYQKIEVAKEALTATKHVREAFQIKAQMLKQFVRRSMDDGKPQLQV